jgi:hypothetical protein
LFLFYFIFNNILTYFNFFFFFYKNFIWLFKVFTDIKHFNDAGNINTWLDIVWSLVVLEKANNDHLESVLSSDYVSNLLKLKGTYI